MEQETKVCQNCKNNFAIESEDFDFYKKIQVPPPTWCWECRMQRRMTFRNERSLYVDSCDLCNTRIFSMYSPDSSLKVYCRKCMFSDKWDPLRYGREYDWKKPFFEQYKRLFADSPHIAVAQIRSEEGCDYANYIADSRHVYLAYSVVLNSENVMYSKNIDTTKECLDSFDVKESEIIYENVNGRKNYRTSYLVNSKDCIDCSFLFDCVNCQNCFMSFNLRGKQFVFRNTQLTKGDYAEGMEKLNRGSHEELEKLKKEFELLVKKSLHKYGNLIKTSNSSGNDIDSTKDARFSFSVYDSEHIKYAFRVIASKDVYDVTGAGKCELVCEAVASAMGSSRNKFVALSESTSDSAYIDFCVGSSSLFGCIGLRQKHYCILNRQYPKEEYEKLVPKIIEHMNTMPYIDKRGRLYKYGEFFPPELSPFAYNETIAQEYFPLTKEEAIAQGYRWRDPEERHYEVTIKAENLPDHIKDVGDSILKETVGCVHEGRCNEQCTTAFKVIEPELQFYREMNLPLPRLCPNCRHYQRLKQRNPLKLWHRECMCDYKIYQNTAKHAHHPEGKCPNEFETSYAPERPEVVYCEQCYNAEVA